ncbi:hypothetical protein BMF94_6302 [Rhodotorula taiwanensis]|uniref:Uncharacterized protein n=1 Tax=Rhodotorula taiwanensis TaxID=741276 RepID=A0A2S5B1M3_9BASI|nr:hypothetical protein BMF94_6302 [Rhodotorula taiwanensis]
MTGRCERSWRTSLSLSLSATMAYSRSRLHNPIVRPPRGPRTPNHIPASLNPLASNRNAHIVRLYSVLVHLVSLPPSPTTSVQLVRAWRALAGCREVHLGVLWRLGAAVIDRTRDSVGSGETARDDGDDDDARQERAERRAEWLKACQEGLVDRVDKFGEYALALVAAGRIDFALDELDGYLDNQPYHDSIALNTLYGQLALLSAQPASLPYARRSDTSSSSSDSSSSSSDDESTSLPQKGSRRRRGPENGTRKRARVNGQAVERDYGPLLRAIADEQPSLFAKATQRLRRAAHLEERIAREVGHATTAGEAARWLDLIRTHVDRMGPSASRQGSPLSP